jgi:hypothetical protein
MVDKNRLKALGIAAAVASIVAAMMMVTVVFADRRLAQAAKAWRGDGASGRPAPILPYEFGATTIQRLSYKVFDNLL